MNRRTLGYLIAVLTVIFALAPAYRPEEQIPTRIHHLLHAVVLIGAGLAGILIAHRKQAPLSKRAAWLVLSIVAPMLAMFLMWPSNYSPLDRLPAAHVFEHLGLAILGFLTGYAGQQYAYGVGTAMSLSMWCMAFLAAWGFGVSPPLRVANAAPAPGTPQVAQPAAANAPADPVHGKTVFAHNCSACHGGQGQGGMGPSLVNEASRKNTEQAIAWIENPAPPMPKLYPSTLNAKDVRDVAAYVESLK